MQTFNETYVGQLRSLVGDRLLLIPGARVIIENSSSEILLQLRSDFNTWGLPGGNAECGESLDQVIKREVFEETGLKIKDLKAFGFGNNPQLETHTFPNGDKCQFFVLNFYTASFAGILNCDQDETLKLQWFDTAKLPKMLPNMYQSVLAYQAYKRSGKFQIF